MNPPQAFSGQASWRKQLRRITQARSLPELHTWLRATASHPTAAAALGRKALFHALAMQWEEGALAVFEACPRDWWNPCWRGLLVASGLPPAVSAFQQRLMDEVPVDIGAQWAMTGTHLDTLRHFVDRGAASWQSTASNQAMAEAMYSRQAIQNHGFRVASWARFPSPSLRAWPLAASIIPEDSLYTWLHQPAPTLDLAREGLRASLLPRYNVPNTGLWKASLEQFAHDASFLEEAWECWLDLGLDNLSSRPDRLSDTLTILDVLRHAGLNLHALGVNQKTRSHMMQDRLVEIEAEIKDDRDAAKVRAALLDLVMPVGAGVLRRQRL